MTVSGLVFMAIFMSGLGLALFRHPLFGLYTYLAVFYLHPPSRWWGAFLPDWRWSLLAALVTGIAMLRLKPEPGRPSWLTTTPAQFLIAFTLWGGIQSPWALDPAEHEEMMSLLIKYILLFWMIYRLVDTPQKMTTFLLVHVLGCMYLGWLGLTSSGSGSSRLDGVGGPGIDDANTLGMHLGTGVMAGAMLILVLRGWRQYLCMAAMALILNTIVLAASRGAFVGILAGGLMLTLLKPQTHRRLYYVFAVLGVLSLGYVASDYFWERMETIGAAGEQGAQVDLSTKSRLELFKAQVKMAQQYPFGTGHRGTATLSPQYLDPKYLTRSGEPVESVGARSSHNTFMTVWVEHGIPGVLLYLWLLIWGVRSVLRARRVQRAGAPPDISMIACVLVSSLVVILVAGNFADYLLVEVQIWMAALLASLFQTHAFKALESRTAAVPSAAAPAASEPQPRASN